MNAQELLFGTASFPAGSEYRQFQHRFGLVLILVSILVTAAFILAELHGLAVLHQAYLRSGIVYCALNILAYWKLRKNPDHLEVIAAICITASLLLEAVAFMTNTEDEMRVIWFALSIPAAYLLIGTGFGVALTAASMLFIIVGNSSLAAPYSPSAIVTIIVAILYISAAFFAFSAKSVSFHHALVQANNKLAELASTDPLTTLFNARAFSSMCEHILQKSLRDGAPCAMVFVDLDHFKAINDTYGHEAGDTVLHAVAQCLKAASRGSDVIGRIGGEEFSLMLADTDRAGALRLAEKIREEIEALMPCVCGINLRVTASIGVAGLRPEHKSVNDIQNKADQAMYLAKRNGRNMVVCIEDHLHPGQS